MSSVRDRALPGYFSLWRASFLEVLAYRASVAVEFCTYPLAFLGYFFFIQGLFQAGHGPPAYSLSHLLTYFSLAWLLRMILNQGLDVTMSSMIANGQVVHELLKPLDFHLLMLSCFLGKGCARLFFFSLPALGLLFLIFGHQLQFQSSGWPGFLLFLVVGFWISFELQFFIGALAFYLTMNYQISWTLDMLIRLASGLIIPLNLFPAGVARLLECLPFQYLYFVPIQAFLSPLPAGELAWRFLLGLFWAGTLWLANRVLLARALRHLMVFGG